MRGGRAALAATFVLAACTGRGPAVGGTPADVSPSPVESGEARALAQGRLELPAANAFGEAGFHEVLTTTARVPEQLGATSGLRLVVSLSDASRPSQSCSQDHPLSGCATVDWSDDPSRPNVPAGGVFDNSVTVRLSSGPRTFYLSQSGALADHPDPFVPG